MTRAAEGPTPPGGLRLGGALRPLCPGGALHPLRPGGVLLLLRPGGVLLLLVAGLVVASCGSTPAGPYGARTPAVSGAPASGPATSAGPVLDPAASAAAGDLLASALEPLRAASSFVTSVTVDGAVVVSASGRSVGDATQTSVTTSGRTVDYVRLPNRAWARETGGKWVVVDAKAAPAAPLAVLAKPATVTRGSSDGRAVTLVATYPAAALGLRGDPVTVTITADEDAVRFTYEATAAGRAMSSTTTLRAAPADPIDAPGT